MLTRLRRWPVAVRMLVSALVLVLVILPLAGALLAWNFRQTVSQSFDERLLSFLNVVIAGIEFDPQTGEPTPGSQRSEEHTSELQSRPHLVCRLLLEKKKKQTTIEQYYWSNTI